MTPHQDQMARRLCQLLDSAADDLSPRIQSRLAAARGQALARLDEITRETGRAGRSRGRFLDFWRTPWQAPVWSRLALTAIPAILLVLAMMSLFSLPGVLYCGALALLGLWGARRTPRDVVSG